MPMTYVKHETLSLKFHPELNEKWVQDLIANDPSIIGAVLIQSNPLIFMI
jgi:hypothetical protein